MTPHAPTSLPFLLTHMLELNVAHFFLYAAVALAFFMVDALRSCIFVPGGSICFCLQCSAAMTQSGNFVGIVQAAAAAAGRTVTLMRTVGPAADHVINPCYPEGAYLTGALFYVV